MSTITTINGSDTITSSRTVINTNFSNLNTDKIETSYLDTDTTLAANSDVKIATQKAVKTYVDAGGNVNATTSAKGIVEIATDAEVAARTGTGSTGATLVVSPTSLSQIAKFGGTGADGALSISSGTTTIDCSNAAVVTKNYTSISITGTGKLAFSNPNTNGTLVVLKSQGNITLTSSQAPMIDMSAMGAAGGAQTTNNSASTTAAGTAGSDGNSIGIIPTLNKGSAGTSTAGTASGGAAATLAYSTTNDSVYFVKYPKAFVGAGGGSGGACNGLTTTTVGGAGGRGGGGLILECNGSYNFTTASGISIAGQDGASGSRSGNNYFYGGGGGGAGGYFLAIYNTLTASSGTITATGGTGGAGGFGGGTANSASGGGGGANYQAGNNSSNSGANQTSGGNGAAGYSLTVKNTELS